MRIYRDLARWYPLMTPAGDYADETAHLLRLIDAVRVGPSETLLELGAGPGHMASHLKKRLRCTLTDVSPQMLDLSRALNPECTHVLADMRLLDLQERFDVVLAQDAIDYMTTEADLKSTIAAASKHLRPGGVAVFMPDYTDNCNGQAAHPSPLQNRINLAGSSLHLKPRDGRSWRDLEVFGAAAIPAAF